MAEQMVVVLPRKIIRIVFEILRDVAIDTIDLGEYNRVSNAAGVLNIQAQLYLYSGEFVSVIRKVMTSSIKIRADNIKKVLR